MAVGATGSGRTPPPTFTQQPTGLTQTTVPPHSKKFGQPRVQEKITDSKVSTYEGTITTGTKNYLNGTYNGEINQEGQPQGKGKITYLDGGNYVGTWDNGVIQGDGIMTDSKGNIYEGTWNKGQPGGPVTITYLDGRMLTGNWTNGTITTGTITYVNVEYNGEINQEGHPQGKGTLITWEDSVDSVEENQITYRKGIKQEGTFDNGAMSSSGCTEKPVIHIKWPDGRTYTGEFQDGKSDGEPPQPHGQGTFTFEDGRNYEGKWEKGLMHGEGIMRFPDKRMLTGNWTNGTIPTGTITYVNGDTYVGEINQEGHPQGKGTITSSDGRNNYEGEWAKGLMNGQGIMIFPDGRTYEGKWEEGLMHGEGKMTYPDERMLTGNWTNGTIPTGTITYVNGDTYEGEINQEGQPQGQGTFIWNDGRTYVGEWAKGLMHGKGIYTWANGDEYNGDWEDGNMNGQGKMTSLDGRTYDGQWEKGLTHGKGIMTFPDGRTYDGQWNYGTMDGKGKMTYPDERMLTGIWVNGTIPTGTIKYSNGEYNGQINQEGQPQGQGSFIWNDGRKYVGAWDKGVRHGEGIQTWNDGRNYMGAWDKGVRQGQGIQIWRDGRTYVGQWAKGLMHGQGIMIFPDGTTYEGEWKDGKITKGTIRYVNGDKYEGKINQQGQPHGKGEMTYYRDEHSSYLDEPRSLKGIWTNGNIGHKEALDPIKIDTSTLQSFN